MTRSRTRLSEVLWWLVIVGMSLIDGVGFYVNISLLLADQDAYTLAVVVAGCSAAAVILPSLFGQAVGGGTVGRRWPFLASVGLAWGLLAGLMIAIRLTSDRFGAGASAGGGLNGAAATEDNPYAAVIVSVLFFVVYLTTGLLAFRHAAKTAREAPARRLEADRARVTRELRREERALVWERSLLAQARASEAGLREAEQLELAAIAAFAQIEHQDVRLTEAENLGEPDATEALFRQPPESPRDDDI